MNKNDETCYVKVFTEGHWENFMHGNLIDIDCLFTNCPNKLKAIQIIKNIFGVNMTIDDIAIFTFERFEEANKGREVNTEMMFSNKRYLYEMASELTSKSDKISEDATNFFTRLIHKITENHSRSYFINMKKNPLKDQIQYLTPNIKDNVLVKEKMKKILLNDYLLIRNYVLTYDKNAIADSYKIIKDANYSYDQVDIKVAASKITLNIKNIEDDIIVHGYPELEALSKAYGKGTISLDKYINTLYGEHTATNSDMHTIYNCSDEDDEIKMR